MWVFIIFFLAGVTDLLMAPGRFPGNSGTRNLHDNLSDLRAQVAANQKVETFFLICTHDPDMISLPAP